MKIAWYHLIMHQFKMFMSKYSKMTSAYFMIWPVASFINAIITCLFLDPHFSAEIFGGLVLIFIFSCIFSIPILLTAMLISAIVLSFQTHDETFGVVFLVTLFSSFGGAIVFRGILELAGGNPFFLGLSIVVSALAAVIIFRDKLKADPVSEK